MTIDGTTQPGYAGIPLIEIDGTNAGLDMYAFRITGGSTTIRGFAHQPVRQRRSRTPTARKVRRSRIEGPGGNVIAGNYLGTDTTGDDDLGNHTGVHINNSSGNTIGGPACCRSERHRREQSLSGFTARGTLADGNTIEGNYVGVTPSGDAEVPNLSGITLNGGDDNFVTDNVISGNDGAGVFAGGGTGNEFRGNYIGTNAAGTAALPNSFGVQLMAGAGLPISGTVIGGTATGEDGNIISGNLGDGLVINAGSPTSGTTGIQILGNLIGVNANLGDARKRRRRHLDQHGWDRQHDDRGARGGLRERHRPQRASGHRHHRRERRRGDHRGLERLREFDPLEWRARDRPRRVGVTANDALDADSGPNDLQNFPVLNPDETTSTLVSGTLNSEPDRTYTIDVYASTSCDPSGNGEGEVQVESFQVNTDSPGGNASFEEAISPAASGFITATATDTASGNTSEFSSCVDLGGGGGGTQPGPVYTVNDNSDLEPFDDVGCTTTECTLREAIQAANTDPADNTIAFNIVGDTQIALDNPLPSVTDTVVIDGTTQEGISVNGDGAGAADGFFLGTGSDGSTIKGLEIRDFGNGTAAGIRILSPNNTIQDNHIWAVVNGIVVGAGESSGVTDNTIGGDDSAGEGNQIWDFDSVGVRLDGAGVGNKVQGNTIGLDLGDEPSAGNTGIYVGNTPDAVIGAEAGPDDLDVLDYDLGNVVVGVPLGEGGNGIAITLGTTGAVVAANFIGTDRDEAPIGNVAIGIQVAGSSNNQFGPGNTIAYNEGGGIQMSDSDGNRIVANSIHDNEGSGISLSEANEDVSEPTLTEATFSDGSTTISGTVSSGTTQTVHIELFANADCDPSGFGEGETYLGSVTVELADNAVPFEFPTELPTEGDAITATTTDATSESTSEFSNCVTVSSGGSGGTLTGSLAPVGGNANLTALGTQDWAVWGTRVAARAPRSCRTPASPGARRSATSSTSTSRPTRRFAASASSWRRTRSHSTGRMARTARPRRPAPAPVCSTTDSPATLGR